MGLKAVLLKTYLGIENFWYGFLDLLEKRLHVPIYRLLINPVEKAGIPSLVFCAALALVAVIAIYLLSGPAPPETVSFTVIVQMAGEPVAGAEVKIEGGGLVFIENTSSSGLAKFEGIPLLDELTLSISKDEKVLYSKPFDPRKQKK